MKNYFNKSELKSISKRLITIHTTSGIDRTNFEAFNKNLGKEIEIINNKVKQGTYKFTRYREKLIIKNRNSLPRVISIPTNRDKVCLKALHLTLQEHFNYIKQPLIHSVLKEVVKSLKKNEFNYFIKTDIESFYDNIDHCILINKLNNKKLNKNVLDLTVRAIKTPIYPSETHHLGIHQGLAISNLLADFYVQELDELFLYDNRFKYFRYVDDILIFCDYKDYGEVMRLLFGKINELKLNLSSKKTDHFYIDKKDISFLGYSFSMVNKLKISPSKKAITKFKNRISQLIISYKKKLEENPAKKKMFEFELNLLITGSISKKVNKDNDFERGYGWVFFYSQLNDFNILYGIDHMIEKLINKHNMLLNGLNIKKISRAFYEQKYRRTVSNYFFKPDLMDTNSKRKFLKEVYLIQKENIKTAKDVNKLFQMIVYKKISELERDLLTLYRS